MIYTELTENTFANTLSSNPENGFSYNGAVALFNYLEDFGADIEFCPVVLRCEYSEMNEQELLHDYGYKLDDEDQEEIAENWPFQVLKRVLEENTTLIEIDENSYIICTSF